MSKDFEKLSLSDGIVTGYAYSHNLQTIGSVTMKDSYVAYLKDNAPIIVEKRKPTIDEMVTSAKSVVTYAINANVEYAKKQVSQEFFAMKLKCGLLDHLIYLDKHGSIDIALNDNISTVSCLYFPTGIGGAGGAGHMCSGNSKGTFLISSGGSSGKPM